MFWLGALRPARKCRKTRCRSTPEGALIIDSIIRTLDRSRPLLIAGPTASGKSAFALLAARHLGGPVVNADALQVYSDWRILTARPTKEDEAAWTHRLYGHVPGDRPYSVGDWLRDLAPLLDGTPPVIVGGTGLYFSALTEGLAEIPPTPEKVRAEALTRIKTEGAGSLLAEIDVETAARIDRANPMRIQRAWEVLRTTGRGLALWQDQTPPPLLPLSACQAIVIDAPRDWLDPRIEARFERMLAEGALTEARRNAETWHPERPSAKAIGAAELIAHVRGEKSLEEAMTAATLATRQFAKRQRSWFRARMKGWRWTEGSHLN